MLLPMDASMFGRMIGASTSRSIRTPSAVPVWPAFAIDAVPIAVAASRVVVARMDVIEPPLLDTAQADESRPFYRPGRVSYPVAPVR